MTTKIQYFPVVESILASKNENLKIMIKILSTHSKRAYLSLFAMLAMLLCSAQNRPLKNDFWSRVRFGGGLGLGFTNGGFNAAISPSAIYQFNGRFAAGTSLTFNYAKLNDSRRYAYGASILTLYNPLPFLQLSAEFEQLRINRKLAVVGLPMVEENYWSPALWLGPGYTDRNFTIGIRYNVMHDREKSIYASAWLPFVRVYF